MMVEDNELSNGVDLAVSLTPGDKKIFEMVDEVMDTVVCQGEVELAMAMARSLRRNVQASGLALAKLLYCLNQKWELVGGDDDMYEVLYSDAGISRSTIQKYITMWGAIFENPGVSAGVKEELKGKPIKSLLLLTAAAREGEIDEETWEKVADTTTSSEVRGIVRDIRGERTSSREAIVLELNLKSGVLFARKGDMSEMVGVLNVMLREESSMIDAAITRIVNNCSIMER